MIVDDTITLGGVRFTIERLTGDYRRYLVSPSMTVNELHDLANKARAKEVTMSDKAPVEGTSGGEAV